MVQLRYGRIRATSLLVFANGIISPPVELSAGGLFVEAGYKGWVHELTKTMGSRADFVGLITHR